MFLDLIRSLLSNANLYFFVIFMDLGFDSRRISRIFQTTGDDLLECDQHKNTAFHIYLYKSGSKAAFV